MSKQRRKSKSEAAPKAAARLSTLILSCFFISGMTGLTYEILWTRMIVKIIGSAPFAVAIVLTVFMGGLGLGSYLAGRKIDQIKREKDLLRLYGLLEIIVGLYALVLLLLLWLVQPLVTMAYNSFFSQFLLYNLFTFVVCAALLLLPVTCMGATLPVLSRFYVRSMSHLGTHVGRLYGLNTIGAAVGSLICGFWMIAHLGVLGSLFAAMALNLGIGLACLRAGARMPAGEEADNSSAPQQSAGSARDKGGAPSFIQRWPALVVFAVSGFCAMGYQVMWVKLLGLVIGPTTYSFTVVLVTFITGLALGSLFFGWLSDRTKNVYLLLVVTQVAAALTALVVSHLLGNSQIFFSKLIYAFNDSFFALESAKGLTLFIFLFLPTFCLGATFPLVVRIYTRSLAATGRSVGFAYAVNSLGAVLGSFCAGFILIPLMGKEHGLSLLVAIQLVTALLVAISVYMKAKREVWRWGVVGLVALGGLIFAPQYPHWDRTLLARSKYHNVHDPRIQSSGWMQSLFNGSKVGAENRRSKLVYFGDGVGGFTTVFEHDADILGNVQFSMLNSGKVDASTESRDMITQTLLAHYPLLLHPAPRSVLVLGLASGITAGEALCYPLERLDILEINRQVVAGSHFFDPWNSHVLEDPRTNLIIQDGRAHMMLTNRRYDVVISEPSNPWMAGLASLFTRDFFEAVRNRLNDNGIFCQWVHGYQMDWATFALIGRTFAGVFSNSYLVSLDPDDPGGDFLLIGVKGDRRPDPDVITANLPYARKSENVSIESAEVLFRLLSSDHLMSLCGEGPINSDAMPRLEFAAPRQMYTPGSAVSDYVRTKGFLGPDLTALKRQAVAEPDAQLDYLAFGLSVGKPMVGVFDSTTASAEQEDRFAALIHSYCSDHLVLDFTFAGTEQLQSECLDLQTELVEGRLKEDPQDPRLYVYLGIAAGRRGELSEAKNLFSKALELNPSSAVAHDNLGILLAREGKVEPALSHFRTAVRLEPDNPQFQQHLSMMRQQMSRPPGS